MKFKTLLAFLLGVGVGTAGAYYFAHKKMLEEIEEESKKLREYYADEALAGYSAESNEIEPPVETVETEDNSEDEEESFADAILKNSILTEAPEKPDIFDYARITLNKEKKESPVEKSIDPVDDGPEKAQEFKMRKVTVTEFEDLTFSYDIQELTVYQDGYVTDYKDEPVFMFKDMYPDAKLTDQDETGHIYVAADYNMVVYDITVALLNYKDVFPDSDEED